MEENRSDFISVVIRENACSGEIRKGLSYWNNESVPQDPNGTIYGYILSGTASIHTGERIIQVPENFCFCVPGAARITGTSCGYSILADEYHGMSTVTGPVERRGRVGYIDGCEDTLLISPLVKGDPCLNLLYMPSNINQTRHTHPSDRIGLVIAGNGICRLNTGDVKLEPGLLFLLPTDLEHSFHTDDSFLNIVVFHPDSDFGPENTNNPMLNRSMVKGVSAKDLTAIHTNFESNLNK